MSLSGNQCWLPTRIVYLAVVLSIGVITACNNSASYSAAGLSNASSPEITPTYDDSGQVTEPSIRYFPSGWGGFHYWLVVAPYPNSNAAKENPSILVSDDGASWEVPPGLTNPIDLPVSGHLADSELFYDQGTNQLWVYYIWEDGQGFSHVLLKTSSDGIHWSQPQDLYDFENYIAESPTVEMVGRTYYMWSVNGGAKGCSAPSTTTEYRMSTDGVTWSAPKLVNISQSGFVIWHIEVRYIPSISQYWMLSAAYPEGKQCGETVIFFSNSTDGINWTSYSRIALGTGSGWDSGQIYRSTFAFDPSQGLLKVWYSARTSTVWHIGFTSASYMDFLSRLQN